jgi:hypothetical protein
MMRLMIDCRLVAAFHESAHATAAAVMGEPIYSILIRNNGSGEFRSTAPTLLPHNWDERAALDGLCTDWQKAGGPDVAWLSRQCVISLAGPSATSHLIGEAAALAAGEGDIYKVRTLIAVLSLNEQQQIARFDQAFEEAQQLVLQHWTTIHALATFVYSADGEIFEPEIRNALRLKANAGTAVAQISSQPSGNR